MVDKLLGVVLLRRSQGSHERDLAGMGRIFRFSGQRKRKENRARFFMDAGRVREFSESPCEKEQA
jgi:hypothetical protein